MSKYQSNTKLFELFNEPIFQGWQHMLDYRRDDRDKELEQWTFARFGQEVLNGCNYLYEQAQKRQVFYPIWNEDQIEQDVGKKLTGVAAFPCETKSKFAVICSGGGYGAVCSVIEGYPLAKKLNEMGYAAFVVCYRAGVIGVQPNPQEDLAASIRFIMGHVEDFNLDAEDYAVIGFSAGAHLAGCFGIADIGYERYHLPKPGVVILGYPVISMGEIAHIGSRKNLFGEKKEFHPELIETYSIEKRITFDYPKTFLWQCSGDPVVSIEHSRLLANSLRENGVDFRYEVYPYSCHGLDGAASDYEKSWIERATAFWKG